MVPQEKRFSFIRIIEILIQNRDIELVLEEGQKFDSRGWTDIEKRGKYLVPEQVQRSRTGMETHIHKMDCPSIRQAVGSYGSQPAA